jgi:ribosome biogenesis GTPase
VGDDVEILRTTATEGTIEEVAPRRSKLSRAHPARGGGLREDVLVANVDQLVFVFAHGEPRFRPRLLDRFLVIAEHQGIRPIVAANKVDRATPSDAEAFHAYERLGYRVIFTSATRSDGLERLREALAGHTSAFAGPSGVGKSSLLNAAFPGLDLRVGATSDSNRKGRHTTRHASLHPLPTGGFVVDTPGIRELATFEITDDDVTFGFVEMRPHVDRCRFRSCRHLGEPGCGIADAVDRGEISAERYESYRRLRLGEERDDA